MASLVNLDAMIPREDLATLPAVPDVRGSSVERISITNLANEDFFSANLRKPDFQRETTHWTPEKIADLVRAFVGGDLIPAVILWRRGHNIFVIDGAHRLSALMAWVRDDYGDGMQSIRHFGGDLPDEQKRIAERTRQLIRSSVAPYAELAGLLRSMNSTSPDMREKLTNLAVNAVVAQWVPKVEEQAAEDAFFKINQAATPIDVTERDILKKRQSAGAIAARAISKGGAGHKYWAHFEPGRQAEIERSARKVHDALYKPALESPSKTLDVPVGGRGYSTLPFIYEFLSWQRVRAGVEDGKDEDGSLTLKLIDDIERLISLVTGTEMRSLGLHPLVYFYTRGGEFQPTAFVVTVEFIADLAARKQLERFTEVRSAFEAFLLDNKQFVTAIAKKTGAKGKSHGRLLRYMEFVYGAFAEGKEASAVLDSLKSDKEFAFLTASLDPGFHEEGDNPKRRFSRSTKTAAFLEAAFPGAVRCGICNTMVHANSMQFDHKIEARRHGPTTSDNARPVHPYCNSVRAKLDSQA